MHAHSLADAVLHIVLSVSFYVIGGVLVRTWLAATRLRRFRRQRRVLVETARARGFSEGYEAGRRDCSKELEQGKVYR